MVWIDYRLPTALVVLLCLPITSAEVANANASSTADVLIAAKDVPRNWKDRGEEFFKVEEDDPVGIGRFNDSLTHQEAVLETVGVRYIHVRWSETYLGPWLGHIRTEM
jgi:hypothetical protein